MPTITPSTVPSRFQLQTRFMRLILALFLSMSRPVPRYPVRLYLKAVRRLFSYARHTVDTPLFYLTFIKSNFPTLDLQTLAMLLPMVAVIGDVSRVKNSKWLESGRSGD